MKKPSMYIFSIYAKKEMFYCRANKIIYFFLIIYVI